MSALPGTETLQGLWLSTESCSSLASGLSSVMSVLAPFLWTTRIPCKLTHSLACHPEDITLRLLSIPHADKDLSATWPTGRGVLMEDYRDNRFALCPVCMPEWLLA